ncbi:MAG: diguanylate cyclase domain-containing protein [Acidimicrobiia bacterium]
MSDALFEAIVAGANELITVFDRSGMIVFASEASRRLMGYEPSDLVGRHVLEFAHPDDSDRAAQTLRIAAAYGTTPGTTHFRLRAADGSFQPMEMTSATVAHGAESWLMTISRPAGTRFALDAVLRGLLEDRQLHELVRNVCDMFAWRAVGTHIAVAWQDARGNWDWCGTPGCPSELAGLSWNDDLAWAEALRAERDVVADGHSAMSPSMRDIALRHGRAAYWISPVTGAVYPTLISVWTAPGAFPPTFHSEGMALARRFMHLIVSWADQRDRLDRAARVDELTGLPNRRSFFDALSVSAQGAILYCDLDGFKSVNDKHGHGAGDEVLRQVGRRLRETVRAGDTVARIGGDEFAIICPASTADDAAGLAARIRAVVEPPIDVGGAVVQVGISTGISHTTDRLDATAVAAADRDLYAAKAERRRRFSGG